MCRLAVWPSGRLAVWPSARVAVWPSDRLAVWPSGRLTVWPSGRLAVWPSGRLAVWPSGRLVQPTPRTADVTVTKIAGYVRVRILTNRGIFFVFLAFIFFYAMATLFSMSLSPATASVT